MKKSITKFIFSLVFSLIILSFFISSVSAFNGAWTSGTSMNWYGVSEVGTTYTGGAGDAVTVILTIKLSSGGVVGSKTVGATIDQKVFHDAWGQPLTNRYGTVAINGYHNPWFHANY